MDGYLQSEPTGPGIGHNTGNPPPAVPIPEAPSPNLAALLAPDLLADQLRLDHEDIFRRKDALLEGCERFHDRYPNGLSDDDEAGKASAFVQQIQKHLKLAEDTRAAAKAPFLEAGRVVDSLFNGAVKDPLTKASSLINTKVTAFLKKKADDARDAAAAEAKRKAEEAEKLAEQAALEANDQKSSAIMEKAVEVAAQSEEAGRVASSSALDLSRTRSAFGTTAGLRDNWRWEVADLMELVKAVAEGRVPLQYLQPNETLINGLVKPKTGLREIPGLRIWNEQKAGIR